ncbi:rotatin homolog anastral spindle 3 [Cochliomyia hominivorax]
MSSIKINRDTLNKLTHESLEIRLRTLDQLSSKLDRALALNEVIEFKPADLCKQLIRWFGFLPIQEPEKVLNLLKSVIESPKYGVRSIEKLGAERIEKELRKIQSLFNSHSKEHKIIHKLKEYLRNCTIAKSNILGEKKTDQLEDLIQSANKLNIATEDGIEYNSNDYEIAWSHPSSSDYKSMKFVSDILVNQFSSNVEIENAIQHLIITMKDYPAEYMLQAPHIYRSLLQIYDGRKNSENHQDLVDLVSTALLEFLLVLEKRIKMLKKSMTFQYAYPINSGGTKDTQAPNQLKVEKVLNEIFDASIIHLESHSSLGNVSPAVWELVFKVLDLVVKADKNIDILFWHKITLVVNNLYNKFAETEHCARLRLHQMLLIFLIQDAAEINAWSNSLEAIKIFEPLLRDYTMKYFYNTRHQLLENQIMKVQKSVKENYEFLNSYEKSLEISIKLLIKSSTWCWTEILKEGRNVCAVLNMLQSKELIEVLFTAIIQGISVYQINKELKLNAIDILLKILNITCLPLKIYIYDKIGNAFKKHLGCMMTGERYIMECSNVELLEAHIIGIPLNTELLLQFLKEYFETSDDRIKKNCSIIFELLLQSRTLFGTSWWSLLSLLVPLLPLLSCCTFSEKIMNLLLKLYDPDLKQLPYVNVLRGNLVFLFHTNSERRSEALIRLIYTLNSLKDSGKYVPNLIEIGDTLPNDICLQSTRREYRNIFSDRLSVHNDVVTSLYNLLHLLDSPDVEPLVRKTTLMQINVLCNNWHITGELCNLAAYYLILQALENALHQSSEIDYPDAAVPAISILNKLMLYDSSFRCELAESPNIYVLLLRSLMMFNHDIQVRQDATMCLFQLLFSTQLITTEKCIEGPSILSNIQLPLDLNLRPLLCNKIKHKSERISALFASSVEETQYWRMVVASTYFGGLANITQKSITLISQLDIIENLKLTSKDIRLIRATQPCVSLQRLLKAALNATEHRSLIQVCILLKQHMMVLMLRNTYLIEDEYCVQLNNILKKYLQMPPGNNADLELYEHLIDLTKICMKVPLLPVVLDIFKIILKDRRHALITMITQREEISLRIFQKIASLLEFMIKEHKPILAAYFNASECSTFYSDLFDLFIERCMQLFEIRDLQRVRCLLSLLVAMSSCQLDMPDQLIFFYCRRFAQFSLALKSFTQTGAQWHRDCLLSILQLSDQMQFPNTNFRLTAGFVKYLSGLCGHNDVEVRSLAWSILNVTAKTKAIENIESERKSSDISGINLMLNELSYLPGGFMACCLSTLLDMKEAICVRHLAGQLMTVLIQTHVQAEAIEKLIEHHNLLRLATDALTSNSLILDVEIPKKLSTSDINITSCDLISCHTLICIELSLQLPQFLNELCTRSFMFKLYEILKQPPPISRYNGYLNMVGHICRLYAMCYSNNWIFLQRTICRDAVWISSFCQILFGIVASSNNMYSIINMLQLLLVICKDPTSLEILSIKLQDYSTNIVKLFQSSLAIKCINTRLRSCVLSILGCLLSKSQPVHDSDLSFKLYALFERKNVSIKSMIFKESFECENKNFNKETIAKDVHPNSEKEKELNVENETCSSSIGEQMCISLIRLFIHLYPIEVCKFSTPPNENQQHVTETLGLLLKMSPASQETAKNFKLHDNFVKIFKNFLEEFASTSCTTYVKRHGESKKIAVIKNVQLLLNLLMIWYSSPKMMITDNILAMDYCKILIQVWPWLVHSIDLKLTVLQTCAFLSESSIVVCKQFSTLNNNSFPHSILQLVAKMMIADTIKFKKNSSKSSNVIFAGLRVLINCCSCLEGRNALNKLHILDIFDNLYPFNSKATQIKLDIVINWLEFWELFSRYEEGAQSRHLNALCSVVNKSLPGSTKRLMSLRILRNMSFLNCNRSVLITSNDFIFTLNEIVSQPIGESVEEQFLMCVSLWKLISGGIKFVSIIRGTRLAKNLRLLKENLAYAEDENNETVKRSNDLLNVLNIIFKIFNN